MTPTPNTPPRSSSPGAATSLHPQPVAGLTGTSLPASASAATTPAAANVAGGFPISEAREAELLRAVPRLHCTGEIEGFRAQLAEHGEKPTGAVEAALVRQAEKLK